MHLVHEFDALDGLPVREMCEYWGIPFLTPIPLDPEVRESGDVGEPVILRAPGSPASDALTRLAQTVTARVSLPTPRLADPS